MVFKKCTVQDIQQKRGSNLFEKSRFKMLFVFLESSNNTESRRHLEFDKSQWGEGSTAVIWHKYVVGGAPVVRPLMVSKILTDLNVE